MDLTNEDVADVLALLDSLPYDELDLQTTRFRLILRRTPDGWTQSAQVLSAPDPIATTSMDHPRGYGDNDDPSSLSGDAGQARAGRADEDSGAGGVGGEAGAARAGLVAVRAPLPGTFYRAPRPGAPPFVEVGSQVSGDTVIGIVETMKLMNSVPAGAAGTVAEICVANAEFAAQGTTLLLVRADP
jgi:acetyl-CoA carboxylase biotin carboxyl carrier protein